MPAPEEIEQRIAEAGARLFREDEYRPRNRRARAPMDGLPIPRLSGRSARAQARRVVKRAPEVMVKITGGSRGMAPLASHLDYITRNGDKEFEDETGAIYGGSRADVKDALTYMKEEWRFAGRQIPQTSSRREDFHIMWSMPSGTEAALVMAATRSVAKSEFSGHKYAMVLHTDQAHPHVHLVVRAESTEDGSRLNPRKADLARWRTQFARELRALGVQAEATRQAVRGTYRLHPRIWERKAQEDSRLRQEVPTHKSAERILPSRQESVRNWGELALALARSEALEDRQLAVDIVHYLQASDVIRDGVIPMREQPERVSSRERHGPGPGQPQIADQRDRRRKDPDRGPER